MEAALCGCVSLDKGCYIGQEVINRIHSIGHVNRELRGLRLADDLKALPAKGRSRSTHCGFAHLRKRCGRSRRA